ncbi:MAG TPA: SCO family protein [Ilumatobacteraceae bacterium]|nr:SCO family protein [Ilumatobacteraceae bacterium]
MNGRLDGRLGRWLRGGALVLWCTLAMWIVCAIALLIYAGERRDPVRHNLIIPAGTEALVAAGENPLEIPSHWNLRSGDVLVLDNRESTQQVFGAWSVGPGERREVLLRPFTGIVQCTLHPDGELTLDVAPDTTDWKLGLIATLAFGPTLGIGALLVARLVGVLNHTEGAPKEKWPPASANRPLLIGVVVLSVLAAGMTVVLMRPWEAKADATLNGFIENPVRDVSDQNLPDAATGEERSFVAKPDSMLLVYFGYTSCPDICPTTMSDLARAVDQLDPEVAARVEVAMVTIDPQRDTAEQLAQYVPSFHAGWFGLRTDDRTRLDAVVAAFGAAYEYGSTAADGSYEVAHSSFVYGIDQTGHVIVEWPSSMGAQKVAHDLTLLLQASEEGAE